MPLSTSSDHNVYDVDVYIVDVDVDVDVDVEAPKFHPVFFRLV